MDSVGIFALPSHDPGLAREWALCGDQADLVAPPRKLCDGFGGYIGYQLQAVARIRECASQQKPWGCQRFRRRLSEIDQSGQEHGQGLGLPIRPLCAVNDLRRPVMKRNAGVQGVEGQFTGREYIGVT